MVAIIWDIQAEHLDEAEFLLEMWTNCVDSPKFTLAELHKGPEERLLARIDGLLVGRAPVVERLLLPVLQRPDDDEFRTAAATLAILQGGSLEHCAQVLRALEQAEDEGRRGLVRALILARRSGLIQWLAGDIERHTGPALIARLLVLAGHRVDVGARLIAWLGADELELRRAAALLARHTASTEGLRQLDAAMQHRDATLRWAAIESGLIRGWPGAWERVWAEAFAQSSALPHRREALACLAMLGDAAVHQRLLTELTAAPTPALLWAAGLSGRRAAVDIAVELLEHPTLARLAGELVCAIAGLSSVDDRYWLDRGMTIGVDEDDALPELDDDELDAELSLAGDQALRLPNPEEIQLWWARRRPSFAEQLRHLAGRPLDAAQLLRGLHELSTRRRHPLALELAARSQGRLQITTRTLACVQYQQLRAIASGIDSLDFQRGRAI